MECKNIEKYLLKSLDTSLNRADSDELERHLKQCPACQAKQQEYLEIQNLLRTEDFPPPLPNFWERLKPRLQQTRPYELWPLWKQWGIRTIPVSLGIIFFVLIVSVLLPPTDQEISQSGILLRDQDPFSETIPLLGEEEMENPNMAILFTSLEEKNGAWRY